MTSLTRLASWYWLPAELSWAWWPMPYFSSPLDLGWVSHKIVTETPGEQSLNDQSQCASTYQASTCIMLANILLAKATHMSKPRVNVRRKQTSFYGRKSGRHTQEGVSCQKPLLGTAITHLSFITHSLTSLLSCHQTNIKCFVKESTVLFPWQKYFIY